MRYTYILQGLDCANCAHKIEDTLNQQDSMTAQLDFVRKKLSIECSDSILETRVMDTVRRVVHQYEPEVEVRRESLSADETSATDSRRGYGLLIRIMIAVGLWLMTQLIEFPEVIHIGISLISYAIVGYDVVMQAIRNFWQGNLFSEHFLMTIATLGAFIIGEYSEAIAVMAFYLLGQWMESRAVQRVRHSIGELDQLRPMYVNRWQDGTVQAIAPEEIRIGDEILVRPGERVPLDGKVVEGSSALDTSMLTGEATPIDVVLGDEVVSGSINLSEALTVEVTRAFHDSTMAQMMDLIQQASQNKAPMDRFISRFARIYTPIVVAVALFMGIIVPLLLNESISDWFYRSLVFLVISCPCALVLSVPLTYVAGIGGAARHGMLIKGGQYIEALSQCKAMVFDKTGTLSEGRLKVQSIISTEQASSEEIMRIVAHAEAHSNHPIAQAIREFYQEPLFQEKVSYVKEEAGYGIAMNYENSVYYIGNKRQMIRQNVSIPNNLSQVTRVYLAREESLLGWIEFADPLKSTAPCMMQQLRRMGTSQIMLLSGDDAQLVQRVGETLDITHAYGELLPQDKVVHVQKLRDTLSSADKIGFVGDGMNDAPVIALADVGIAMGKRGTDLAIEASDVVLLRDRLEDVVRVIRHARFTQRIAKQNIIGSLAIKFLFLLLGSLGLATMWQAVFADVGVTVLAVLNAVRAYHFEPKN